MKGAVAAGHPITAEAGARVLTEGGNAVDACIAAGFASWVTESPLTGPGSGGFMLVHRARDGMSRLLDFFVAVPGLGRRRADHADMHRIDVEFDPESTQIFHIGAPSCAVPGTPLGLEAAHRVYGSLPWPDLVRPAVELAREGVEITPGQGFLHAILDSILRHTPEGRRIYGERERLVPGDVLLMPDLADTLECLASEGAAVLYRGDLADRIVRHLDADGGEITLGDLASYRVIWRRPVRCRFQGAEFVSNPPPSSGGTLIAYGLRLLESGGLQGGPGSAEAIALLAEVMREQNRVRTSGFAARLHRGGLARELLADESVQAGLRRLRGQVEVGGTTHISAVDARGNAASLSCSTGSGSGVVVPGTGIGLNNMLGEYDLGPGRRSKPGMRMTSMMAPSVALADGRPRLVVGSAGSLRLRGAIMQIVVNVLAHGLRVEEAIERPRVHLEEPHLHCEGRNDPAELDRLESWGFDVVRWRRRNLYFGGAAAVETLPDGSLAAAGDPRRGGAGIVVQ
jgi:gamma-glutamyltranspeptidase / glutathione hydrolase